MAENRRQPQMDGQRPFVERRKRRDWVTRSISYFALISWVVSIAALLFLDRARPRSADFFTYLAGEVVQSSWNKTLLLVVFLILIVVVVISIAGFFLNMTRHRRKSDKFNPWLITICIASVVGLAAFLIVFWSALF